MLFTDPRLKNVLQILQELQVAKNSHHSSAFLVSFSSGAGEICGFYCLQITVKSSLFAV